MNTTTISLTAQRVLEEAELIATKYNVTQVGVGLLFSDEQQGNVFAEPNLDDTWTFTYTSSDNKRTVIKNYLPQEEAEILHKFFGLYKYAELAREISSDIIHSMVSFCSKADQTSEHSELVKRIPSLHINSIQTVKPFTVEGTIGELAFCFLKGERESTLTIAHASKELFTKPLYTASRQSSGSLSMGKEAFTQEFFYLIDHLQKAPFLWRFESNPEFSSRKSHVYWWGETAKEAWNDLLVQAHLDEEWFKQIRLMSLSDEAVNYDDREFIDISIYVK